VPAYAKGHLAWGLCSRCGLRYLLRELVLDGYFPNIRVCQGCYDPPQPQERLAVVSDPVALWKPAPDTYLVPPPFLTAEVVGGSVVLNWTSIMAPAVGNDVGGPHHGPYLSAGYEVYRAPGQSVAEIDASLLLHMDGVNGSTSFPDSSIYANVVTASGGANVETSTIKFGTGAGSFNFFEASQLTIPVVPNGPLDLSVGDYTIECWLYPFAFQGDGEGLFFLSDTTGFVINLFFNSGGNQIAGSVNGNGIPSNSGALLPNVWSHVALVMKDNSFNAYVNGIGYGETAAPHRVLGSGPMSIGGGIIGPDYSGYIDEFRIVKGYAVYTGNFTPPNAPFTPVVVPGQVANQFSLIASFTNTPDEFGALSIETLTYTDTDPPTPTALYYVRGYDTHENAQNG
jgi:hypothetical protein